jgi:hypothetical protein
MGSEVKYSELVDHGNIVDKAFDAYVTEFMQQHMPDIPMGMLDTSDIERWRIEPEERFEVRHIEVLGFSCPDCGELWFVMSNQPPPEGDCGCVDEDDEEIPIERNEDEDTDWYVVADAHYVNEPLLEDGGDTTINLEGDEVAVWFYENEAEQVAAERNQESWDESRYSFPWASSYVFLPGYCIDKGDLAKAGFIVGEYLGGKGDWREDDWYDVCGIDGGGYSFKGAHFAKLAALTAERLGWPVPTDKGDRRVTTDERPDLVKLYQDSTQEAS